MTLDKFVEGDILSTCNALGSEINGTYEKGTDCIECLKDILRYLKKDDDHVILRFLGSIRLLQTDLLPLIKRYDKDKEIFDFTLRILVALTNPAILLYKENVPEDKITRNTYLQIISYLQSYKKAFIDISVWKTLYEHLKDLLKVRPVERSSSENLFVERIIILIRNVLHVASDDSVSKLTNEDASPHDKILECLHESKLNILILYMSANEEEHKYCLHVLEVISLMFREHTAESLASASETRSAVEKEKDLKLLLAARQREQSLKSQKIKAMYASRFNGVYCVKNMKSISDKDYISHKPIRSVDDIKFDTEKDFKRKPKNRLRASDVDNTRHSTLSVRLFLKKFCIEFLKTYNKLLVSVKRELLRKVSNDHDDTYYLWAICYFMQFNRFYDFQPALVSETISVQSFHHIQTQITNYQEMMMSDKKNARLFAKRMQLGVSAYKELLETLKVMEKSPDEVIRDSADTLISHVFYVIEYREMLLSLLSNYDEVKFPLSYLAKLVESAQLFLKMLENHSKKHSEIIVQKKQKKVHRRKKKKPAVAEPVNPEDQLNQQWEDVCYELSFAVEGLRPVPNVTPFDGASEMSFEEQKVEAVHKIREAIIANEPIKALGLLRAARELWPEGDSFGAADIEPEPEFMILREIHFSNLQRDPTENNNTNVEAEDFEEDEEDEETEAFSSVAEQRLDINDVYKKYATHKVVQPCALLLANYRNNTPQTNACLIKLLHRIAWNCKMYALFFQSTIFLTFQKIFHDPDVNFNPLIKEFYRFARFIVQKFVSTVEKNDKVFVELLFWKGSREAYELEEGYETSGSVIKNKGWTEDEEEELKHLYEENKDIYIEGQDVADIILASLNPRNKTKQQIISALKKLGLIKGVTDLKPEKRKEWQETEVLELQHLFEDYKNSDDVMGIILDKLSIKRSRKAVTEKLLELNLVADRKELRKKSSKHRKSKRSDSEENSSDGNEDYEDNHNPETYENGDRRNLNSGSSDNEDEEIFFKNLEAERYADDNGDGNDSHSKVRASNKDKTAKGKRPPKVWEEQEIMELTALFKENRDSNDVMQIILDSLSVKRSKQAVIEKLLELRLITDKKEIREKSKSGKQKHNLDSKKHSEDITGENSGSDLENSVIIRRGGKLAEKKKKKRGILSDSSDEDISLSSILKDSKENENSQKPKQKKEPKAWNEEEIIELNRLFMEHRGSDDIMTEILRNLTIKRTKKSVLEKLLEIRLIKDASEVNKKNKALPKSTDDSAKAKRKKPSQMWEEQEIAELNQLYQNYKNSDDIMTDILNGLTVKRNKQDVVQKMLEVRLIQDKKEIRKKRTKKGKTQNNSFEMDVSDDENLSGRKEKPKKKHRDSIKKKVLADSSEDEDVPLNDMAPSTVKNNKDDSYKNKSLQITLSDDEDLNMLSKKRRHISTNALSSDSSDGENEPLSNVAPSTVKSNTDDSYKNKSLEIALSDDEDLNMLSKKRRHIPTNALSSDSSDGENEPLSKSALSVVERNINNSSKINTLDSENSAEIILHNNSNSKHEEGFRGETDDHGEVISKNELSFKRNKRKRLQVISDSSDDDSVVHKEIHLEDSVVQNTSISDDFEKLQEYSVSRKPKKRHVLEDSDDSS